MGEPVPTTLASLASLAEHPLETELDAREEVDGDSFEHMRYLLFALCGHLGRFWLLRSVLFIPIANQVCMLANVADDRLILKNNDSDCENGTELTGDI